MRFHNNNNTRIHLRCSRFQKVCLFFLIAIISVIRPHSNSNSNSNSNNNRAAYSSTFYADAYRVGDSIDAAVSTRSSLTIDLLMANQPLFGLPRTVHLPRLPERFSLSFEEGLHSLPYVDGQSLEQLIVTFVYSKSGGGRIHSVTSKAIQQSKSNHRKFENKKKEIEVQFDWVEEAAVDLEAGSSVMFLAAFVVSILFLLQLCTMDHSDDDDDDDDDDDRGNHNGNGDNRDSYYKGR